MMMIKKKKIRTIFEHVAEGMRNKLQVQFVHILIQPCMLFVVMMQV